MKQTVTTATTKGVVLALILIVLALAIYFLGMSENRWVQIISYVIFIAGIIWSVTSYGKQIDYNSTFGKYFAHGFKTAATVTALMIIYIIIFFTLFPEIKEKAIEMGRKSMEEKGTLTPEQINQALAMTRKFFMVYVIAISLLGYLIFGAIAALIGAGVTKKNPRLFDDEINQISS